MKCMSERCIVINGGSALNGSVEVRGAKNAVLPLLAVSILTSEDVIIENCPYISDIDNMLHILGDLGAYITRKGTDICVHGSVTRGCAEARLYKTMRSSMFMLGALLSVLGEVEMPMPGGCAIGARPLDIHLDGLRRMGAHVHCDIDRLKCTAERLHGAEIVMRYPSVGATENLLMCAALAKGNTTLVNCAREPEIVAIAQALKLMGAKIRGEGTSVMRIEGVRELSGATLRPCGDRIVAGTVLSATALCGGDVMVYGADANDLRSVIQAFRGEHCRIDEDSVGFRIRSDGYIQAKSIITAPFPLFPTDMQPQFLACQCFSNGVSRVRETVFEGRFAHAAELAKLGADISVEGNCATVVGGKLHSGDVYATDLRAGAGLCVACMKINGESRVLNPHFIDRGYENFIGMFSSLGVGISEGAL